MMTAPLHDALAQVRQLQEMVLQKRQFMGYSGWARISSGTLALTAAAVLDSPWVPRDPASHLRGWVLVLALTGIINYACLIYWFLFDADVRRNPRMLKPAVDALPALLIGGVLTVALVHARHYDLLFGVWMCLYGLAQVSYRLSLPAGIYGVGLCYIACGTACLLAPGATFLHPWPMGLVFFLGELAGGLLLIQRHAALHAGPPPQPERTS